MNTLENTKSNSYQKTHQLALSGACRKF